MDDVRQPVPRQHPAIRRVAVVATGVIGASWAAYFVARGLKVVATDPAPGAERKLREAVEQHWPTLERLGLAADASPANLAFSADLQTALDGADFVQENGPEREGFKIDLFARMDAQLAPHVILASSSSGLLMTRVQSGCAHPERVGICTCQAARAASATCSNTWAGRSRIGGTIWARRT